MRNCGWRKRNWERERELLEMNKGRKKSMCIWFMSVHTGMGWDTRREREKYVLHPTWHTMSSKQASLFLCGHVHGKLLWVRCHHFRFVCLESKFQNYKVFQMRISVDIYGYNTQRVLNSAYKNHCFTIMCQKVNTINNFTSCKNDLVRDWRT